MTARPPRDNLFRAVMPGIELVRADPADDGEAAGPVMVGHFSVFNQWTEINSWVEGNFMERFVRGAFKKTIREQRDRMRVLFQHGMDMQIGDKPLGPIRDLREDDDGAYYEVPLLDAPYVREDILPGLEAGLYGASFRFRVMREEIVEDPEPSEDNPKGLPERTVKEAEVREFGPVTFPAYAGASAGVRSLTDDFIMRRFAQDPERARALLEAAVDLRDTPASEEADEERDTTPDEGDQKETHTAPKAAPSNRLTPLRTVAKSTTTRKGGKPWLLP